MSRAERFETLRKVTIPLLTPCAASALVYAFVGNLQDFDTPLVPRAARRHPHLPTLIISSATAEATHQGIASVYATLFVV